MSDTIRSKIASELDKTFKYVVVEAMQTVEQFNVDELDTSDPHAVEDFVDAVAYYALAHEVEVLNSAMAMPGNSSEVLVRIGALMSLMRKRGDSK